MQDKIIIDLRDIEIPIPEDMVIVARKEYEFLKHQSASI